MPNLTRKIFSLNDMKYGWSLLVSILVCGITFYIDRNTNPDDLFLLSVGYGMSFVIAVVWGAANYIGHVRMNVMFRRHRDIASFVGQLAMSQEDKLELRNYLEDYAEDLMREGTTKEEAAKEAISQFKVKEFLSLSKHTTIFELHAHYYLIGWTIVAIAAFIALGVVGNAAPPFSLPMLLVESVLVAYGAGFIALFFVYKLLDALIYKKLRE